MRLFLASEAKNHKTITRLQEYTGGLEGKTIAYIPTAANGECWGSWRESETLAKLKTLKPKITIIQLEDYRGRNVVKILKDKDIIWFAGGYCGYLMYWIRRCELDKALPGLLQKSLYVGSSAGSMIAGQSLELAEKFPFENEPGALFIPPLKLVDFDIFPHYTEVLKPVIKKIYTGKKLYLLKNGEEIIVEDKKVTLFGNERIITGSRFQSVPARELFRQRLK